MLHMSELYLFTWKNNLYDPVSPDLKEKAWIS